MVLKEASMTMESEYEMPVLVPMTQGAWYHIVFIGDPGSKLHEVRMYDYDEKQVYYKKLYGYSQGNIISYGYQPRISEWHMIKPVQVNKSKKDCCGYIMLLKKVKGNNDAVPTRWPLVLVLSGYISVPVGSRGFFILSGRYTSHQKNYSLLMKQLKAFFRLFLPKPVAWKLVSHCC